MGTDTQLTLVFIFTIGGLLIWYVIKYTGNKKVLLEDIPDLARVIEVLGKNVSFFKELDKNARFTFAERVHYFLSTTKITAEKGASVNDEDRILIATSATIPLFHFKYWSYENLDEVIVYPEGFDEQYGLKNEGSVILGMVGEGVMNRKMILSLEALRNGFFNSTVSHTAIHEFVHLIDKADGAVDGVPEYLIPKELVRPWINEMHANIIKIRNNESNIRDYAGVSEAEFFAVASEYFFQRPQLLEKDHPELFELLTMIYNPGKLT
ncbi:M90 family metallopeptidase [Sphingobacterium sp. UT-1RO-CII-1]|uniref:M90 family metallopeptidase n=1 Tax=Sphingobacterium sp. UT-1RO-CII-1 TaxID=2995225 RepID=UPI00227B33CA|nr:M90 family metallopeptidase [Sphingobacterium sp. UT-1RO-CII-1]MCY4780988.1 M90 family metallopeptidase [Sphingobacterium sp. UT-1RO-CII-1]